MNFSIMIIGNLLEIFIIHNYWFTLLEPRFSRPKTRFLYYLGSILGMVINYTMLSLGAITLKSIIAQIIMVVLLFSLFKDNWYKKIPVLVVQMAASLLAEICGMLIAKYILHQDIMASLDNSPKTYIWQCTVYTLVFIFSIIGLLLLKNKKINTDKSSTQLFMLFVATQMLVCFIVVMPIYENQTVFPEIYLLTTFVFICSVFLGSLIYKSIKNIARDTAEAEFVKMQLELKDKHFYELKEKFVEYRRLRHDFHNHIRVLSEINDADVAHEYMADIKKGFDEIDSVSYCDNPTLDAILVMKKAEAQERDISVKYLIGECDNINVRDFDLCTILANLLDNAIRASAATSEKTIELELGVKKERFVIKMKNSSEEVEVGKRFKTTKDDRENHGLGLENIRRTAKLYDGETYFNYEDGYFTSIVNLSNS